MCCNNNYYGINSAYDYGNQCGWYGRQGSAYCGNRSGSNYNFIVSARVTPYNPCYINPYTGCAVPYNTSSGCASCASAANNGCGCHCGCGC